MSRLATSASPSASPVSMSKRYYLDPEIFRAEKERIFYRRWQWVGHVCDLPQNGSYFTTFVADEPILVVRGADGEVRAFYNVCQHRAHLLAKGGGRCERFVCPYHGWTYRLDGTLFGARGTDGVPRFDKSKIALAPVRIDFLCGLIFVNLDEQAPGLDEVYPGLEAEILSHQPNLPRMVQAAERVHRHQANWKVSVENFNECYHCPVAHTYLVANTYTADDYRMHVAGEIIHHLSKGHRDPAVHGEHLRIWYLWPTVAIELYPIRKSVSIRHFRPIDMRRTDYTYRWYVDPDLPPEAVADVTRYAQVHHDTTGKEDDAVVASVQLGLESRGYRGGPLVVTPRETADESENAVAHVQQIYLSALGAL